MADLGLSIVRFRMDHDVNYQGTEPAMKLIAKKGYVTTGFMRGSSLAVGQIVHAQTSDGRYHWIGWITAQGLPDWSGNLCWFFVLYVKKHPPEGVLGGGDVTVTVTVTDPNNTSNTSTIVAVPTPQISEVP